MVTSGISVRHVNHPVVAALVAMLPTDVTSHGNLTLYRLPILGVPKEAHKCEGTNGTMACLGLHPGFTRLGSFLDVLLLRILLFRSGPLSQFSETPCPASTAPGGFLRR